MSRDPAIIAVLIESVASRRPTDVYALAAILASDENRAVIVEALNFRAANR